LTFLEEVSLLSDLDKWNDSDEAVTLMTVHSAKGLEFNTVFISGLEDGLFPIVRFLEDSNIEEERRLFYVALTRAKKKAVLSYARSRRKFGSEPIMATKSRFILEIPENLIDDSSNEEIESKTFVGKSFSIPKFKKQNTSEIFRGNTVEHKVFGKGKVLNIEGIGDNSKLTIKFYNNVTKKLILKYANLKIINRNL
jgi:DNA helicase-2/ATP-dependent DNA helicase PcrA